MSAITVRSICPDYEPGVRPGATPYATLVGCESPRNRVPASSGSNFARHWMSRTPVTAWWSTTPHLCREPTNLAGLRGASTSCRGHRRPGAAEQSLRQHSIDIVVNFAGRVTTAWRPRPGLFFRTMCWDPALLEACRGRGGRFHHISTCEVYGDLALDPEASPRSRRIALAPLTNASKAGATMRAGLPRDLRVTVSISNCANNYGTTSSREGHPLFTTLALDDTLAAVCLDRERREWIHVLDHCRAIEQ